MLEQGDVMTEYVGPTTTAAVSVGPVSGLPRLDYSGGATCPSVLLEGQRTNLITFSEQIDDAAWAKANATITANNAVSPDGYTNADLITTSTTSSIQKYVIQTKSVSAGGYTSSFFVKANTYGSIAIVSLIGGTLNVSYFNITSGTKGTTTAGTTSTIENYGNGWHRITQNATETTSASRLVGIYFANTALNTITYAGSLTDSFWAWGAQLEAGSYATSYIPTLSTSVTRVADSAYKTGISSLIGQTEGTIYLEADIQKHNESGFYVAISDGASLGTAIYAYQPSSGTLTILIRKTGNPSDGVISVTTSNWTAGLNKLAIAYTSTTAEAFINGVSKGTTSFASLPAFTQFVIGSRPDGVGTLVGAGGYSQALLFKTRLPNSSLEELTTL